MKSLRPKYSDKSTIHIGRAEEHNKEIVCNELQWLQKTGRYIITGRDGRNMDWFVTFLGFEERGL